MTTDMLGDPGRADNMPEHFAALLYRIVAGRNCWQLLVVLPSLRSDPRPL